MSLDALDRKILSVIQSDGSLSLAAISERVGLSQTPCWKRIRRLEADGVISRRVVLLDRAKLGLGVTVFVTVRTNQHDDAWSSSFAALISEFPEVVEFYRMSGEADYLMKIVCADIAGYDAFYKKLTRNAKLFDVSSSFAMEQIKYTTELPL